MSQLGELRAILSTRSAADESAHRGFIVAESYYVSAADPLLERRERDRNCSRFGWEDLLAS